MDQPAQTPANDEIRGRHRRLGLRTAIVSGMTLVSRILGFVRETLSAALFGDTSPVFDAFITAWRIPNMLRRFLGEGALATAFQTKLTEVDADHGNAAGAALFRATLARLFWILMVVTAALMIGVSLLPDQMPVTAWNWLGADPEPVRDLAVRVTPFLVFVCLAALVGGGLQVRGHFTAPAIAPAAMNLVWIAALLWIGWHYHAFDSNGADPALHMEMVRWLAWGVLLSGLAQLLVQIPALYRTSLLGVPPVPGPQSSEVNQVLWRSLPMALGAAVYQINVMIDGLMAESLLPNGGPTLHYYANRVQQFPLALVAVAATSAVFPLLKAHGHKQDWRALRRLYERTHYSIAFFALPATVGLFVLAEPVVRVLFQHGAFREAGVQRGAAALRMLSLAILPAGATGLCARSFYALGDFKTPVRISIVMLVANVGFNLTAILAFGMDVDGLALATALSSWGTLLMMMPLLHRQMPDSGLALKGKLLALLPPAALCGAAAWGLWHGLYPRLWAPLALSLAIAAGGAAWLAWTRALRIPMRLRD
ncbi:MAG: murein biosynthesis integral membrane protein MurJ [Planctomycetota bacterium]